MSKEELEITLNKVKDALCPAVLGHDPAFYREVARRQERDIFNPVALERALNKRAAQAIMILYNRYMDALAALNGGGNDG